MVSLVSSVAVAGKEEEEEKGCSGLLALVDPFLVDALQNPRHRLTVLRMELDIQRFMQNPGQHQFEFQHLSTSYLRCAAYRVAQYYGLQTLTLDNVSDGYGARILVTKSPESRFPSVCLSELPLKQAESETLGQVKIAVRSKPEKTSLGSLIESEINKSLIRTMEERKEEYDKARARIFSGSCSSGIEGSFTVATDEISFSESPAEPECHKTWIEENEKISTHDGASKVAIFRDREKDRNDPDYDRSYDRYSRCRSFGQNFSAGMCSVHPSFLQYDMSSGQLAQLPGARPLVSYTPSGPAISPLGASACNQTYAVAFCMQFPTPAMVYAYSHERSRQAIFQGQFYQQPLSFDHLQNH